MDLMKGFQDGIRAKSVSNAQIRGAAASISMLVSIHRSTIATPSFPASTRFRGMGCGQWPLVLNVFDATLSMLQFRAPGLTTRRQTAWLGRPRNLDVLDHAGGDPSGMGHVIGFELAAV